MTKRWNFSDQFKAAVVIEALRGDKTVQEIAAKRKLHPTQVSAWKRQAIEGMAGVTAGMNRIEDSLADAGLTAEDNQWALLTVKVKKFDLEANYFAKKEYEDKKESYKN